MSSETLPNFLIASINYSRPIRLGYTVDDPYSTQCFVDFDINCPRPGYEIEYSHTLVKMLNIESEWVYYESYDALSLAMDNNEIDMSALSNLVDDTYASKWHWTSGYSPDGTGFIVKEMAESMNDTFLLFQSFSTDLWASMIVFTIISMFLRISSKRLIRATSKDKSSSRPMKILNTLTYVFRSKIIYGLWFLIVGVILNFYGNVFAVSLLTTTVVKALPFSDITDLGHKLLNKECRFALENVYIGDMDFHGSLINPVNHNKSWADLYRRAYVANPPIYTDSRDEVAQFVLNNTCVIGLDYYSVKMWYESKFCGIKTINLPNERDLFHDYAFYMTRDDIRQAMQSLVLHSAMQSYPTYLNWKYFSQPSPPNCKSNSIDQMSLSLSKLQDAFYVLAFGLTVAVLILIFQRIHFKTSKKVLPINSVVGKSKKAATAGFRSE